MAAPQINTVQDIINKLDEDAPGTWVALTGFYSLNTVEIVPKIIFNTSQGIILKAFLNTRTGEIRTYIAKHLDVGRQIP